MDNTCAPDQRDYLLGTLEFQQGHQLQLASQK